MNINSSLYAVSYQNDTQRSYMVFKLSESDRLIDYQIKIIKDNPVQSFLPLHRKQFDDEIFIYYDITSKITLEQLLLRRKLSRYEFLTMLKSIIMGLQIGKRYLLHSGQYILDIRYIYINPSSLEAAFAYMPVDKQTDIREELRAFLIDLIVYKVVFTNPEEADFVYRLLNLLKSDAFSIEQFDKLVFSIAVDPEETKANKLDIAQSKGAELANTYAYQRDTTARKHEGKKTPELSIHKNKHFVMMLIQLLFAAITILMIRITIKQHQSIDIYSVVGAGLLLAAADFLLVKKLGLMNKYKANSHDDEEDQTGMKNTGAFEKKNSRNTKKQGRPSIAVEAMLPKSFVDMETNVLIDKEMTCAYLVGCQDNLNERIVLSKPSFIIGRLKNQADYISQNGAVGKVHAEIINRDGVNYIRDLNSRNGTYINGERIVSNVEYTIQNNDRIAFANSEYKFVWTGGASQL